MGFQSYIARIVFVVLVSIAFTYREQIMTTVSRALGSPSDASKQQTSEQELKTPSQSIKTIKTRAPITDPDPDGYNPPFDPSDPPEQMFSKAGVRLVTRNELAAHGHSGTLRPIWLAIMGKVFDVDKGAEHYYGPEGGYNFFTGQVLNVLTTFTTQLHTLRPISHSLG